MIVVDASAAVVALLVDGQARRLLATEAIAVPTHVDVEVAHALRGQVQRGVIGASEGAAALSTWARLGMRRLGIVGVLDRVWALRDNLSAYDAAYVALAETLECPLVTADARLSRAPGLRCAVTVVPR